MSIALQRRSGATGLVLLLASCGSASQSPTPEAPAVAAAPAVVPKPDAEANASDAPREDAATPADVTAFQARRDDCDHFRGEEPFDAERAAFLDDALARTCTGTDAELKALRTRYADDPGVLAVLARYEDEAE